MVWQYVASAGLGLLQGSSDYAASKAAAKAQEAAQKRQSKAERARLKSQVEAVRINERFQMEQEATELQNATIKAMKARSRARVVAGESGVSGNSVDAQLEEFSRQEARYRFGLKRRGQQRAIATNLSLKDMNQQSYQNLLTINKPIKPANKTSSLLSGVSTGLSIYSGLNA